MKTAAVIVLAVAVGGLVGWGVTRWRQNAASVPARAAERAVTLGNPVKVGAVAPEFTLIEAHDAEHPEQVTLSKLTAEGPVVVVFYLTYQCGRCVTHLKEMGDLLPEFQKAGIAVVAISPDAPEATREALKDMGDIPLPLLSDPGGKVAKAYGLLAAGDEQLHGVFVVGRDGKVKMAEVGEEPFKNYDEMMEAGRGK